MTMIDQDFEDLKRRLPMLRSEPPLPGDFRLEGPGVAPAEGPVDSGALRAAAVSALKTVYDPEIPLNIYELGLIYQLDVDETGAARVQMTLTAPGCPVAGALVHEVHDKLRSVPGVRQVTTELVWDPPWTRERMSDAARLELGLM
jgi:FeS assembly SUF system protein